MTHDQLTARLRAADHDMAEGWPAMVLAANRLDRYRELLVRARSDMNWCGESHDEALINAVEEAIQ